MASDPSLEAGLCLPSGPDPGCRKKPREVCLAPDTVSGRGRGRGWGLALGSGSGSSLFWLWRRTLALRGSWGLRLDAEGPGVCPKGSYRPSRVVQRRENPGPRHILVGRLY